MGLGLLSTLDLSPPAALSSAACGSSCMPSICVGAAFFRSSRAFFARAIACAAMTGAAWRMREREWHSALAAGLAGGRVPARASVQRA